MARPMDERTDLPPEHFPDYDLLLKLDSGGQGAVYAAVHRQTQRRVAIKVLHGVVIGERERERFLREIEIISHLKHAHIVTLYDFSVAEQSPYYVMEYIDGLDLVLRTRNDDVPTAVRLFLKVCDAVAYAHRNGVLHRDLKPSNVLIDDSGNPFLVDFGLARDTRHDTAPGTTAPFQIMGTLPYLSPEQTLCRPADARSDIFALGVMLFEVLTDELPWDLSGSREAIVDRVRNARPRQVAGDVELAAIVDKCLRTDPDDRYQAVEQLIDDLRRYLAGEAVLARAHRRAYVARKLLYKHRVAGIGVLVGLATIGGVVFAERSRTLTALHEARTALQMGGYIRLASAHRDAGRVDMAATLFREAIQLGAPLHDDAVRQFSYDANQRLAEMYIQEGALDRAREHVQAAVAIARDLFQPRQDDPQHGRYYSGALRLEARVLYAEEQWAAALAALDEAARIKLRLCEQLTEHDDLVEELALVRALQGSCCRKLGDMARARAYYDDEMALRRALYERRQDLPDRVVSYAFAISHTVAWHVSQDTPENDLEAFNWMDRADRLLDTVPEATRPRDVQMVREVFSKNRAYLMRRRPAARLATTDGPPGDSPSDTEPDR